MSPSKDDLPGFYRDPTTGKYYRESPNGMLNPSLKKLKLEAKKENFESNMINRKPLKRPNILAIMNDRELGSVSSPEVPCKYYNMRLFHKSLKEDISLNSFHARSLETVDFIKGGAKSIFGLWNAKYNNLYRFVVGEIPLMDRENSVSLGFRPSNKYVVDMCEGVYETLVYVYNDPLTGIGNFDLMWRANAATVGINSFRHFRSRHSPLFCCTRSRSEGAGYLAIGSDGFVSLYNGLSPEMVYNVKGKVHSISFEETGHIMICGLHNGVLDVLDLREEKVTAKIPVSPYSLVDSHIVEPGKVVVADNKNKLVTADIRNRKIVTEFAEHKHTTRKRPFSIANNMLCAVGADNVIRIWHLSGGLPIYEVVPMDHPDNQIRGWLAGDCNKTYLYYFERDRKKVFEIKN